MQRAVRRGARKDQSRGRERDEADRYPSSRVGVISTSSSTAADTTNVGEMWVT